MDLIAVRQQTSPSNRQGRNAYAAGSGPINANLPRGEKQGVVWETERDSSGCWFFRAVRETKRNEDVFSLEYLNTDNGVHHRCFSVPSKVGMEMLKEKEKESFFKGVALPDSFS